MNFALYPLVFLTKKFSDLLVRAKEAPSVTEDEILAFVRMGVREGQITDRESRLVHNIIALENHRIKEIMTPRTVIFSLEAETTVEDAVKAVDRKGFTRIPVYEKDREKIIGYITVHDLFSGKTLSDRNAPIRSILKPLSFVPETMDCLDMLTTALTQRQYLFVVIDEYGDLLQVSSLSKTLSKPY